MTNSPRRRLPILAATVCSLWILSACQVAPVPAPETNESVVTPSTTVANTPTAAPTTAATNQETPENQAAVAAEQSVSAITQPVALRIPEIDLDVEVSPMTWRVAEVDGKRTTIWVLPNEGAGWHPTSAGVGAKGNVIISGNQLLGDAAFAPIALGDVEIGQEIEVTDSEGNVFIYTVTNVTEPLPISADLADEQAIADEFLSQGNEAILTLVTGWPDFSSTARVIVTAELTATE